MQNPYYWVSWIISVLAVVFALYREIAARRARKKIAEATVQEQIHQVVLKHEVDRATTAGQLELIRHQLAQATAASTQAHQAIKSIIDHEQQ